MIKKAGYEYLLAWKITVPIYDYTVEFCKKYRNFLSSSRTQDQMVQVFDSEGQSPQAQTRRAARSGMTNIAEGNTQNSTGGYLKLTGVNRGSLEELLKDFMSFARQNKIEIWDKDRCRREIGEIGKIWEILKKMPTLPDNPNFPDLPSDLTKVVNLMITLVNQANFLQDRLHASVEKKFVETGGSRENLFKKRMEYRRKNG